MGSDVLQSAMSWYDRGVCPVPCRPRSKAASVRWGQWQNRLPPRELVARWFARECNLALLTGGPGRLLVLDFDRFADWIHWRRDNPELAQTYTEQTARGVHTFLRVSKPTSSMAVDGVDVLGDRHTVMVSPSIHPSGARYEPMIDGAILTVDSLSDAIPDWEMRVPDATREQTSPFTESFNPVLTHRHDLVGLVKRRLPVLAYLQRYTSSVPMSSDGGRGRWWVARCPSADHTDANPSFWIDNARGLCSCFKPSCAASQPGRRVMDVCNLHSWLTGMRNGEAIRDLARLAGV